MSTIPANTVNSVIDYLNHRKNILLTMVKTYETKYGNLEHLREKIGKEGVPEDDHTIWDDLIMWENLDHELKQVSSLLKVLNKT